MPGFDRTGPSGQGSLTGRRMGKCKPANNANNNMSTDERPRRLRLRISNQDNNQGNYSRRGNGGGRGRGQRNGGQRNGQN